MIIWSAERGVKRNIAWQSIQRRGNEAIYKERTTSRHYNLRLRTARSKKETGNNTEDEERVISVFMSPTMWACFFSVTPFRNI